MDACYSSTGELVVMDTRFAVNLSMLFPDRPVQERAALAAAAGFDAVESWWPWVDPVPSSRDVDAFVRSLDDAGVQLVGLNLAAGDMEGGDRGLVSWPGRERQLRDNVAVVLDIAELTRCRTFNALYGNRVRDAPAEWQDELAAQNLAFAAASLDAIGGRLVVEPLHGAERYPLRTAADALAVIDRVACDYRVSNIALLADLYHLAANGDDVSAVIEAHTPRFGHVQIADFPGRGAPGTGILPLAAWLSRIRELGYPGWIGLEYRTEWGIDPFRWLEYVSVHDGTGA